MSNRSVCVVIGTRPEAIKLAPVIRALQLERHVDTVNVVLTGQHREMVEQVLSRFGIVADRDLAIMQTGQTLSGIMARCLPGLDAAFVELGALIVVVQGDTTTALAAALAAFYRGIDVAHVEAGLRTNDLRDPFPEEANRRLISQIATLHFAPTETAAANLKASGVGPQIFMTGNTVVDALTETAAQSPPCEIPGLDWNRNRVILATIHRRESWGTRLESIAHAFAELVERHPDVAVLLPMHRNPTVRESLVRVLSKHPRIFLVEPLDYFELVGAMQRCYMLMTDSGGLQEEAPSLGKPVLVLRRTTERPEAIAAGTARLVGTDTAGIVTAATELLTDAARYRAMAMRANPFGDGHAAARIAEQIGLFIA